MDQEAKQGTAAHSVAGAGYRRDIDGLRAIAVLGVVGFHSRLPFMTGGFVGVDVFFVISGFLITGLLAKEMNSSGTIELGEFYARRVRRLLPALAFATLGTLVLGHFLLLPWVEQQRLARSALATAAFASNIYFWVSAGNYFGGPEREPLLHTWSLSLEEQFYFAWPLTLLASYRLAVRLGRSPRTVLAAVLGAGVACSLAACITFTPRAPEPAFYLMPFRAWEFALGGLLALAQWRPTPRAALLLGLGGLGAIGLATTTFGPRTPFPGWNALLPTLGTVAVLATGGVGGVCSWLSTEPMVRIGQWSYSWYLWHWPLIAIGRATSLGAADAGRDGLASLLALGLAAASYRFVESPARLGTVAPFRRQQSTLAVGLGLSLFIACAAGLLGGLADHTLQSAEPFRSMTARLAADEASRAGCADDVPVGCQTPNWREVPGIVLWGDSHARQLWPLITEAGPTLARTEASCPPLLAGFAPARRIGGLEACLEFNGHVASLIGRERPFVAGVVLAARWPHYKPLTEVRRGLGATLDVLAAAGVRALVLAPLPEQRHDVPLCLLRWNALECATPRATALRRRTPALGALRAAVEGRSDVRLLDLFDVLCPGARCPASMDGAPLYRDTNHVTSAALDSMRADLVAPLAWLQGQPAPPSLPAKAVPSSPAISAESERGIDEGLIRVGNQGQRGEAFARAAEPER